MGYAVKSFAQFPQFQVFIALFADVRSETLSTVKSELVGANKQYDYCFLNTNHLVSVEQLYSSIYRSISNFVNETMRAKTLNTEIIFNLAPINNIMDALKRFGVDESCNNVIVIKVINSHDVVDNTFDNEFTNLLSLLEVSESSSIELSDNILFSLVNIPKLKKLFKLNDANYSNDTSHLQAELTRLTIGAALLRGC
ncbi:kinase binding protein CGI-121-domain-containing protein [Scheffersomyces amazonensis]|uniref:kinase binding protein CGI-121-domain-containing protein n=1 Tax=Scheffersomyces amazonensis TaxID=1078765 RepID=UPI00315D8703